MARTRLVAIDIAKAICIILVVIGHYEPEKSPEWFILFHRFIYSFHMPLFLFASGYVYLATLKQIRYKDFVLNKFKRLMIPYFSISIIIILLKLISSSKLSVQHEVTLSAYYQMFYLPVAGFFLWFIYTLFLIFLIVPIFNTKNKRLILLVLSLILFFIPIQFTNLFCLAQFKSQLIYFVIGVLAFEWKDIRSYSAKFPCIIPFLFFIITYYLNERFLYGGILKNIISFSCALFGIWFTSNLSKYIAKQVSRLRDILLKVGILSYSIYLFHTTFEGFAKAILIKIPFVSGPENNLSFIVCALIIISIGITGPVLLETYIISKSKTLCFLFGVKNKNNSK